MAIPDLAYSSHTAVVIFVTFNAVAIWSAIPLNLRMLSTIREKRSLYFRAMFASSWGLCVRAIAQTFKFTVLHVNKESDVMPWWIPHAMSQIGMICMVSGFALVLWSRLGFILGSERVRKWLLGMIIFNGVVFHTALTVMTFMAKAWRVQSKPVSAKFLKIQRIFESVQIIAFNGQETLISALYIRAAYIYLRDWSRVGGSATRRRIRRTMILLLVCQAVVVLLDIAIITIDELALFKLKVMIHSFVYCVKLEVELVVLNQLVEISKLGVPGLPSTAQERPDSGERRRRSGRRLCSAQEGWTDTIQIFWWKLNLRMRHDIKNPCLEKPSLSSDGHPLTFMESVTP